ncbi:MULTISPECIES: hypothetical protein [Methanosarcina]|uniref:Uncharacterized protein n=1 Tax=Methanosarcina mazei TaxID=2209 RepID=A0A0F8BUL2_METMZ|nr:hypothetical protein [Methanosarcina mazei]KKG06241.1 hypothetical protein DU47_13455 [Methanosarcina mazei]KKH87452.1 hypothetical protein DU80_06695 [Methanosarcina mazei]BBL64163.1 hypothetical protein MmazTMA_11400 [Methanosarcina mazei]
MTTKTELLEVIRKRCLECCNGSYQEVENCTSGPSAGPFSSCALWAYRLGKDPEPSETRKLAGEKFAQRNKAKTSVQPEQIC